MHSIDVLEEALWVAQQAGCEIRQDWLSGTPGGICRVGQRYYLFVDRSLSINEQLEQVLSAMRLHLQSDKSDGFSTAFCQHVFQAALSNELRQGLGLRSIETVANKPCMLIQ